MKENKDYKMWWDDKYNIARAWGRGAIDEESAKEFLKAIEEMAEAHGPKVNWLNDLREIETPTFEARKILAKAADNPGSGKYAFFGASVFMRTVARIITTAFGKKDVRCFASEMEAIEWLKEGK